MRTYASILLSWWKEREFSFPSHEIEKKEVYDQSPLPRVWRRSLSRSLAGKISQPLPRPRPDSGSNRKENEIRQSIMHCTLETMSPRWHTFSTRSNDTKWHCLNSDAMLNLIPRHFTRGETKTNHVCASHEEASSYKTRTRNVLTKHFFCTSPVIAEKRAKKRTKIAQEKIHT